MKTIVIIFCLILINFSYVEAFEPQTDLERACIAGNIDTINLILTLGADVHANDDYAIFIASSQGNLEIVKLLVENGANIYSRKHRCIIVEARDNGHDEVVTFLLSKNKFATKWLVDKTKQRDIKVIKYLLAHGVDPHWNNSWALQHACGENDIEIMTIFLEHGIDVNFIDDYLLRTACMREYVEMLELLLSYGANPCIKDDSKLPNSPITSASFFNRIEVVKILLNYYEYGCSEITDSLVVACYNGHPEMAKLLLDNGANMNAPSRYLEDSSMFVVACMLGFAETAEVLLDYGVDIHQNFDAGFRQACYNKEFAVIEMLINRGINPYRNLHKETYSWNDIDKIPEFKKILQNR